MLIKYSPPYGWHWYVLHCSNILLLLLLEKDGHRSKVAGAGRAGVIV